MRVIRKIAAAIVLCGYSAFLASGCSPVGAGAPPAVPAAPAIGTATAVAQWPQFGYDPGHNGYNPLETAIGAKNVAKLTIAWNDQTIVQPGGIVVNDSVAYVDDMGQSNEGLYALNVKTGAQKWRANLNLNGGWGSFIHAVAAVAGNVVVSPCSNGSSTTFLTGLCGVNAATGKILWRTYCKQYQGNPCGGLVSGTSPAAYGKLVYFQSTQGVNEQPDTEALDPQTGAIAWDVAGVYHCPDAGDSSGNPLPAGNGLVYAVMGCRSSKGATEVCGFAAQTGKAAWCDATASPYVEDLIGSDGKLYLTEPGDSNDLVVTALDGKTGARAWTASLPGGNFSAMVANGSSVFVNDGGSGVFAFAASNGRKLWSYTSNGNLTVGGVLSAANGLVYADGGGGNNGNVALSAFDEKTGKLVWTSGSIGNGSAPATPVIVNGAIYAGCYTMCAFRVPAAGR